MFPVVLDGAKILYHTAEGDYGVIRYSTGEIFDSIHYYAIGKYETDSCFYLFGCNGDFEVISDSPWDSIEECQRIAQSSCNEVLSWVHL
ncbi:MAG: hypothetical protein J6R77_06310 [Clostridia bacterium]|nr:hypothetical protein [Clostridia bacterium]